MPGETWNGRDPSAQGNSPLEQLGQEEARAFRLMLENDKSLRLGEVEIEKLKRYIRETTAKIDKMRQRPGSEKRDRELSEIEEQLVAFQKLLISGAIGAMRTEEARDVFEKMYLDRVKRLVELEGGVGENDVY